MIPVPRPMAAGTRLTVVRICRSNVSSERLLEAFWHGLVAIAESKKPEASEQPAGAARMSEEDILLDNKYSSTAALE